MFINFDINQGLSINAYRKAGFAGDIADVVAAYQSGNESVCCILDGAEDALCDGEYLQGSNLTQEAVESVYNFIIENK